MKKKKPIGYTKEETSSMKKLIERTEPKSGDYVGSGTVTEVPKMKKKMKRMQEGGITVRTGGNKYEIPEGSGPRTLGGSSLRLDRLAEGMRRRRNRRSASSNASSNTTSSTAGQATPPNSITTPKGITVKTGRNQYFVPEGSGPRTLGGSSLRLDRLANAFARNPGRGPIPPPTVPVIPPNAQSSNMRGGGLARKGVGQALAKGGLVKANGCAQRGKTKGKMV